MSLPEKEDFYSHLNLRDITDADYVHAKRVCKDFKIKNLQDYYDLYHAFLLGDVFENVRNMCLNIYELDPIHFFSTEGLAQKAALKKTKVKFDFLTYINMLFIVEKDIRSGIYHAIHGYLKANSKHMKNYEKKNKNSSCLKYWDVNNLYGCVKS